MRGLPVRMGLTLLVYDMGLPYMDHIQSPGQFGDY